MITVIKLDGYDTDRKHKCWHIKMTMRGITQPLCSKPAGNDFDFSHQVIKEKKGVSNCPDCVAQSKWLKIENGKIISPK